MFMVLFCGENLVASIMSFRLARLEESKKLKLMEDKPQAAIPSEDGFNINKVSENKYLYTFGVAIALILAIQFIPQVAAFGRIFY